MNTLYITATGKVLLNEQGDILPFDTDIESIRSLSLLTEDTKVIYKCGEIDDVIEAKAGDIVITFFNQDFPHPAIVVHNDMWKENLEDYRDKEQKRKEEWAAKRAESPCCDGCTKCA